MEWGLLYIHMSHAESEIARRWRSKRRAHIQ